MHKWHLLLFALLAALQPISSFTERNLVDGREECCDRENHSHRDTRLSLYGTRSAKSPENHRLNYRDEIREYRRNEVIHRTDPSVSQYSTRLTRNSEERQSKERSSEFNVRSHRTEYGLERIDERREGFSSSETRERSFRDIRRDRNEKNIARERFFRESLERQDDRTNRESPRIFSRDVRSAGNERLARISIDSRREILRVNDDSRDRRTNILEDSRKSPNEVRRTRGDERSQVRDNRERSVAREINLERRNSLTHFGQRSLNIRASLSRGARENVEEQKRTVPLGSRITEENHGVVRETLLTRDVTQGDRRTDSRRLVAERIDERQRERESSRQIINRDRTFARQVSRERIPSEHRRARESVYSENIGVRFKRIAENRPKVRNDERNSRVYNRNQRVEISDSRRVESRRILDRDTTRNDLMNHRSRSEVRLNFRDSSLEAKARRGFEAGSLYRQSIEPLLVKNASRNEWSSRRDVFEAIDSDSHNIDSAEDQTYMHWQYIFYMLRGMYLFGVAMQMLTENDTGKNRGLRLWASPSPKLLKVD